MKVDFYPPYIIVNVIIFSLYWLNFCYLLNYPKYINLEQKIQLEFSLLLSLPNSPKAHIFNINLRVYIKWLHHKENCSIVSINTKSPQFSLKLQNKHSPKNGKSTEKHSTSNAYSVLSSSWMATCRIGDPGHGQATITSSSFQSFFTILHLTSTLLSRPSTMQRETQYFFVELGRRIQSKGS